MKQFTWLQPYFSTGAPHFMKLLAAVPGVARHEQWGNLIAFFLYNKED
jgi:hypothetical protein